MIYITFSIQISVRVSPPQITGGGFHRFSISATSDIDTELSRPAETTLHLDINDFTVPQSQRLLLF